MIKNLAVLSVIGFFVIGAVGLANATLIGDSVTAQHYYPDLSSPYANLETTIVSDGAADTMYPASGSYYSVNVDADSFYVDYLVGATWATTSFNGLVIDSLDDSSANDLLGVSVLTNMAGWDVSRLSFDADTVSLNWNALAFNSDTYFDVSLDFNAAPVPEPATILLLGSGIAGLAGVRRRRNNKV